MDVAPARGLLRRSLEAAPRLPHHRTRDARVEGRAAPRPPPFVHPMHSRLAHTTRIQHQLPLKRHRLVRGTTWSPGVSEALCGPVENGLSTTPSGGVRSYRVHTMEPPFLRFDSVEAMENRCGKYASPIPLTHLMRVDRHGAPNEVWNQFRCQGTGPSARTVAEGVPPKLALLCRPPR